MSEGKSMNTGEIIDMNESIKLLNTTRSTFYRWLRSGKIKGMKVGRQWRFYRSEIERFLKGEEPRIELPADMEPLIENLREKIRQSGDQAVFTGDENKVVEAVNLMITLAARTRASDIHLANHIKEGGGKCSAILRYRMDGVLYIMAEFDSRLLPAIIEKWKSLAACDIHEHKKFQDGRISTRIGEKSMDLRVSFLPTNLGESITVRIFDTGSSWITKLELDELGFSQHDKGKILKHIQSPWGIVVVSGPTGSGKTTVLYVCLRLVNKPELKVITVEEPVEFLLPWTVQIQVQRDKGETFPEALRAVMRSDPDVIMIGEIQDNETLAMAHNCALTGHLILTTIHSNDATGALKRMLDMGNNPYIITESTKLITGQRLVRKLCPECGLEKAPSSEMLKSASEIAKNGGLDWEGIPRNFREPAGCPNCRNTGYKGRTVVAETLEITSKIVDAMAQGMSLPEVREMAIAQGMIPMAADGIRKAGMGITSLSEVMRVTQS